MSPDCWYCGKPDAVMQLGCLDKWECRACGVQWLGSNYWDSGKVWASYEVYVRVRDNELASRAAQYETALIDFTKPDALHTPA